MTIHISNMDVIYIYIYMGGVKRVECVDIIGFLAFELGTRKSDINFV